jgi:hypothetical protein
MEEAEMQILTLTEECDSLTAENDSLKAKIKRLEIVTLWARGGGKGAPPRTPDSMRKALNAMKARCALFDRILRSKMPLVPTPARLKRASVGPIAFLSGVHLLTSSHCKLHPNTEGA